MGNTPNGQGLIALLALNTLKGFSFDAKDSVDTYHKQIEAMKLAFADGQKFITDADKMTVAVEDLLNDSYANKRRGLIGEKRLFPKPDSRLIAARSIWLQLMEKETWYHSFKVITWILAQDLSYLIRAYACKTAGTIFR